MKIFKIIIGIIFIIVGFAFALTSMILFSRSISTDIINIIGCICSIIIGAVVTTNGVLLLQNTFQDDL